MALTLYPGENSVPFQLYSVPKGIFDRFIISISLD